MTCLLVLVIWQNGEELLQGSYKSNFYRSDSKDENFDCRSDLDIIPYRENVIREIVN